jgi:hypothetical protein
MSVSSQAARRKSSFVAIERNPLENGEKAALIVPKLESLSHCKLATGEEFECILGVLKAAW